MQESKIMERGSRRYKNIKISARMNFIGLQGEKHFRC